MTRRTPGEHRDLVAPSAAPLTRPQPGPIASYDIGMTRSK